MTDTVFAEVEHQDALLAAIRRRILELDTTYEAIEELAGLSPGYLPKILGKPPAKRIHPFVTFILLQTIGLKTVLIPDPEFNEKLAGRLTKRKTRRPVLGAASKKEIRFPPDFMRLIARRGGRARMARLTPEQRSAHARYMVMARWRKARAAAAV